MAASSASDSDLKGKELYKKLKEYVLTERQMVVNKYPRPVKSGSSKAVLYPDDRHKLLTGDRKRLCWMCRESFELDDSGKTRRENCCYHQGKFSYGKCMNCSRKRNSRGCVTYPYHVHRNNCFFDADSYVTTQPSKEDDDPRNTKVYTVDCEMIYTEEGLELAKVTIIDEDLSIVYETLVKPDADVVHYNTKYSGITESQLRGVTVRLEDVQKKFLELLSDETILIGHGLDSDLTVLKLFHKNAVDTTVVFSDGSGYKKALQTLTSQYLGREIQRSSGGHDSLEDARACFDLMKHKLKNSWVSNHGSSKRTPLHFMLR